MSRPSNLSYLPGTTPPEEAEGSAPKRSVLRASTAPERSASVVDARLSEELETLRRYLETAGYLLGQDGGLRYRYATELSNLKHVEKVLGHVARVVQAADKEDAIDRISDGELKARLQRKPIVPWFESKH